MPVFDFPVSPAIDDVYTENGVSYTWDGHVWRTGAGTIAPDEFVEKAGDTMLGPLMLVGNPNQPLMATDKKYVDETIAAQALYQGTWQVAANIPDLNVPPNDPLNGYSWTAQTVDPNIPETALATIPGIGGDIVAALDTIKWNAGLAAYEHIRGPVGISQVTIADEPPVGAFVGQLWWDSNSGKHYCFFSDGTSQQWVQISGGGGGSDALVVIGDTPPAAPYHDGLLWWNSSNGALYVSYNDGTSIQWVEVISATGIPEAPLDGVAYARKDANWRPMNLEVTVAGTIGDVKNGFQPADHGGWIKLDGRAITTLTDGQQTAAISLGFTTNLPDATSSVQIMRGGTSVLGSINGSSAKKIALANLPVHNLALTAVTTSGYDPAAVTTSGSDPGAVTSSSAGGHGHKSEGHTGGAGIPFEHQNMAWNKWATSAAIGNEGAAYTAVKNLVEDVGPHTHTVDMPNHTHTVDLPSHTHTLSGTLPLGGSASDFDVTMKHMHVHTFCYLGD